MISVGGSKDFAIQKASVASKPVMEASRHKSSNVLYEPIFWCMTCFSFIIQIPQSMREDEASFSPQYSQGLPVLLHLLGLQSAQPPCQMSWAHLLSRQECFLPFQIPWLLPRSASCEPQPPVAFFSFLIILEQICFKFHQAWEANLLGEKMEAESSRCFMSITVCMFFQVQSSCTWMRYTSVGK